MKFTKNSIYIILFFVMFFLHFAIWEFYVKDFKLTFIKYYLFLSMMFIMVLTILSIIKKIYPNYIGFTFMGLLMFKLAMMFLIMNKLNLAEVPKSKFHFIPPYLISLLLETLYAIGLVKAVTLENTKDEKNQ